MQGFRTWRFRGLQIQRIGCHFKSITLARILLLHLNFVIHVQVAPTYATMPLLPSHLFTLNEVFNCLLFIYFSVFLF